MRRGDQAAKGKAVHQTDTLSSESMVLFTAASSEASFKENVGYSLVWQPHEDECGGEASIGSLAYRTPDYAVAVLPV